MQFFKNELSDLLSISILLFICEQVLRVISRIIIELNQLARCLHIIGYCLSLDAIRPRAYPIFGPRQKHKRLAFFLTFMIQGAKKWKLEASEKTNRNYIGVFVWVNCTKIGVAIVCFVEVSYFVCRLLFINLFS